MLRFKLILIYRTGINLLNPSYPSFLAAVEIRLGLKSTDGHDCNNLKLRKNKNNILKK